MCDKAHANSTSSNGDPSSFRPFCRSIIGSNSDGSPSRPSTASTNSNAIPKSSRRREMAVLRSKESASEITNVDIIRAAIFAPDSHNKPKLCNRIRPLRMESQILQLLSKQRYNSYVAGLSGTFTRKVPSDPGSPVEHMHALPGKITAVAVASQGTKRSLPRDCIDGDQTSEVRAESGPDQDGPAGRGRLRSPGSDSVVPACALQVGSVSGEACPVGIAQRFRRGSPGLSCRCAASSATSAWISAGCRKAAAGLQLIGRPFQSRNGPIASTVSRPPLDNQYSRNQGTAPRPERQKSPQF